MLEPREDFHLRGALPADLHSPHLPWHGPERCLEDTAEGTTAKKLEDVILLTEGSSGQLQAACRAR